MTKIINLFGACGSGKSTIASGIFYKMKLLGYNVEMSPEWIKMKVFEETAYPFSDQLYTFAKQHKQLRQMVGKTDYIISDSPLFISLLYAKELNSFNNLVIEYFNQYDNRNFLLQRNHPYQQSGRIHNEKQSDEMAIKLKELLDVYKVHYEIFTTGDAEYISEQIINNVTRG